MTDQEMIERAQARALEAVAEVAARRTPLTTELARLAEATILDRLSRAHVVGTTKSGRLITVMTGTAPTEEVQLRSMTS